MLLLKEREGKLIQELKELIYSRKYPITQYRMLKTEKRFEPAESINTDSWELMTNRQLWGGHNETYYYMQFTPRQGRRMLSARLYPQ